jgi:hypothetical protein
MKIVVPGTKRRRLQFSLGLLFSAFTAIALSGATATWIHLAHRHAVDQSQREYAEQMRVNRDRLMALRMNESFEAFVREYKVNPPPP